LPCEKISGARPGESKIAKKARISEGFRLGFRETYPVKIPLFSPEKRVHREKPFPNGAAALDPVTWPLQECA
jgi:hypothetical protein